MGFKSQTEVLVNYLFVHARYVLTTILTTTEPERIVHESAKRKMGVISPDNKALEGTRRRACEDVSVSAHRTQKRHRMAFFAKV